MDMGYICVVLQHLFQWWQVSEGVHEMTGTAIITNVWTEHYQWAKYSCEKLKVSNQSQNNMPTSQQCCFLFGNCFKFFALFFFLYVEFSAKDKHIFIYGVI